MATRHRALLERVQIYLITDAAPRVRPIETFLRAAIAGGVGMVQLRDKHMADAQLLDTAVRFAAACRSMNVPFVVNDRVDIAISCGADGVHVGQDDLPAAAIRKLAPQAFIVGLSTHSKDQIDAAASLDVDYIGVGPIYETPTKEGRVAVGTQLVHYAAEHAAQPFFAIGGLDQRNVAGVVRAGAHGVSVLRCIAQSDDPKAAARELLGQIEEAKRARSI